MLLACLFLSSIDIIIRALFFLLVFAHVCLLLILIVMRASIYVNGGHRRGGLGFIYLIDGWMLLGRSGRPNSSRISCSTSRWSMLVNVWWIIVWSSPLSPYTPERRASAPLKITTKHTTNNIENSFLAIVQRLGV